MVNRAYLSQMMCGFALSLKLHRYVTGNGDFCRLMSSIDGNAHMYEHPHINAHARTHTRSHTHTDSAPTHGKVWIFNLLFTSTSISVYHQTKGLGYC